MSKVVQLDADLLDRELYKLFERFLVNGSQLFNENWYSKYLEEIKLGLRFFIYKNSVWKSNATYGSYLQGLKYVDAHMNVASYSRKSFHCCLTVLLPYIMNKYSLPTVLFSYYKLLKLCNFVAFLYSGSYRSIENRLCGLTLIPESLDQTRSLDFQFVQRQILWQTLTEFIIAFYLDIQRCVSKMVGIVRRKWRLTLGEQHRKIAISSRKNETCVNSANLENLSSSCCANCRIFPVLLPSHGAQCHHIYCYYCLQTLLLNDTNEICQTEGCLKPLQLCISYSFL